MSSAVKINQAIQWFNVALNRSLHQVATLEYEKIPALPDRLNELRDVASKLSHKAVSLFLEKIIPSNTNITVEQANAFQDLSTRISLILKATESNTPFHEHLCFDLGEMISQSQLLDAETVYQIMVHVTETTPEE